MWINSGDSSAGIWDIAVKISLANTELRSATSFILVHLVDFFLSCVGWKRKFFVLKNFPLLAYVLWRIFSNICFHSPLQNSDIFSIKLFLPDGCTLSLRISLALLTYVVCFKGVQWFFVLCRVYITNLCNLSIFHNFYTPHDCSNVFLFFYF